MHDRGAPDTAPVLNLTEDRLLQIVKEDIC